MTAEEIELEQVPGGRLDQLLPSWEDRIKINVKHIILDEELKKRKCVVATDSRAVQMKQEAEIDAAKRREAAEMERKRRADMDNAWEASREERVSGTLTYF